jgi:hypothetical protein
VVKRRHGLNRFRYRGEVGMQRWVGLGVIADNLINIGRVRQKQSRRWLSRPALLHKTHPPHRVGFAA